MYRHNIRLCLLQSCLNNIVNSMSGERIVSSVKSVINLLRDANFFSYGVVFMSASYVRKLLKSCILFVCKSFFIGPESDHWLCLSLTDSLTNSLLFSKLESDHCQHSPLTHWLTDFPKWHLKKSTWDEPILFIAKYLGSSLQEQFRSNLKPDHCLVEILKRMQGRDSEDVWSRFV